MKIRYLTQKTPKGYSIHEIGNMFIEALSEDDVVQNYQIGPVSFFEGGQINIRINETLLEVYARTVNDCFLDGACNIDYLKSYFKTLIYDRVCYLEGKGTDDTYQTQLFIPPFMKYVLRSINAIYNRYDEEIIPNVQVKNPNRVDWVPSTKEELSSGPPADIDTREWVNFFQGCKKTYLPIFPSIYPNTNYPILFGCNNFDKEVPNVLSTLSDEQCVEVGHYDTGADILVAALLGLRYDEIFELPHILTKNRIVLGHIENFNLYYEMMACVAKEDDYNVEIKTLINKKW